MNNQQYAKLMLHDNKVTEEEKVSAAEEFLTIKIKEMYQSEEVYSDASQRALRRDIHLSFNELTKLDSKDFDFQIMMNYSGHSIGHTPGGAMMKSNPPEFHTLRIVKKVPLMFSSGIDWASVGNIHTHPLDSGGYGNHIITGTITAGDIYNGNLGTSRIMTATTGDIEATRINAGAISSTHINNASISAMSISPANISATSIDGSRIHAHSITADHLATSLRGAPYLNIHTNSTAPVDYSEQLEGDWAVTSMTERFTPEESETTPTPRGELRVPYMSDDEPLMSRAIATLARMMGRR